MKQLYALSFLFSLAACTTIVVDEPPVDGLVSIGFSPQAETRAAVTGTELPNGSRFNVWGGYGGNNVFSGREVTKTANGCIYQGTEYWMPGQTYNFYAVYPAGLKADAVAVTDEGTVTVSGFDCSATGDAAVDLMTASATSVLADLPPKTAKDRCPHTKDRAKEANARKACLREDPAATTSTTP